MLSRTCTCLPACGTNRPQPVTGLFSLVADIFIIVQNQLTEYDRLLRDLLIHEGKGGKVGSTGCEDFPCKCDNVYAAKAKSRDFRVVPTHPDWCMRACVRACVCVCVCVRARALH